MSIQTAGITVQLGPLQVSLSLSIVGTSVNLGLQVERTSDHGLVLQESFVLPLQPSASASAPVRPEPEAEVVEPDSWFERLRRARTAGEFAAQKLAGSIRCVPRTPPLLEFLGSRDRIYIVLRGCRSSPGAGRTTSLQALRARVGVTRSCGDPDPAAVFHGFRSLSEAKEYCLGAGVELPAPFA